MDDPLNRQQRQHTEPQNVLDRLKRGLAGYVSYLAACEMNKAFSEYVLYEPMLRILTARNYQVECEVPCPGIRQPRTGDKKKIDFTSEGHGLKFAIEVKWVYSNKRINIEGDRVKLVAFKAHVPGNRAFLCVFGRKSHIGERVFASFREIGSGIYADLYTTRYGCRMFELE